MPIIKNILRKGTARLQNLKDFDVFVDESGVVGSLASSQYFVISEFPPELATGNSSFKIEGSDLLRPGVELKTEILDSEGNPIFHYPIPNYNKELPAQRVGIEVYNDVANGTGFLYVLGELDPKKVDVPQEFQGIYNVRFTAPVVINKDIRNTQPIKFFGDPTISVTENVKGVIKRGGGFAGETLNTITGSFIANVQEFNFPSSPPNNDSTFDDSAENNENILADTSQFEEVGNSQRKYAGKFKNLGEGTSPGGVPIDIEKQNVPAAGTVRNVTYALQSLQVGTNNAVNKLSGVMKGAELRITNPHNLVDSTLYPDAQWEKPTSFTSSIADIINDTTFNLVENYTIRTKTGIPATKVVPLQASASQYKIIYTGVTEPTEDTLIKKSFANITVGNLRTFSGDTYKSKIYMKEEGSSGGFEKIYDVVVEAPNQLVDQNSITGFKNVGSFHTQSNIENYWVSSSNVTASQHSSTLIDGVLLSGSNYAAAQSFTFITSQSYSLEKNESYVVEFNTAFIKKNKLDLNGNSTAQAEMEVFLTGSAISTTDQEYSLGKVNSAFNEMDNKTSGSIIGVFNDFITHRRSSTPTTKLGFRVNSGQFVLQDVSLRPYSETNFSPGFFKANVPMPNPIKKGAKFDFLAEFYDANNNLAETVAIVEDTQFDGAPIIIQGTDGNSLSGSMLLGQAVEMYGTNPAFIKSVGYQGFAHSIANNGGGFLLFSGSIGNGASGGNRLTASEAYDGVGLEIVDASGTQDRYLKFRTSPSTFQVKTNDFYFGQDRTVNGAQFISGSLGNIEISSSNFHLSPAGAVVMSGKITATAGGTIGGFTIGTNLISASSGADIDGVVLDSEAKVITFHGADGKDNFSPGTATRNNVRLAVGQIASGIFGIQAFDSSGDTLLNLSENAATIAGFTVEPDEIKVTNLIIDSNNEKLTIGGANAVTIQGGNPDNFITMKDKTTFGQSSNAGIILGMDATEPTLEMFKNATNNLTFNASGLAINTATFDLKTTPLRISSSNGGAIGMGATAPTSLTAGDGIFMSGSGVFRAGNADGPRVAFDGTNIILSSSKFMLGSKGSSNSYISSSGNLLEISSSKFRLSSSGDVSVEGTITATDGAIGGFYLTSTDLYAGNATLGNANTKIVLGDLTSGTPKFALGATANSITLTGGNDGVYMDGGGDFRVGDADGERISYDKSEGLLIMSSSTFMIGSKANGKAFISASGAGDLEISSSNFHLSASGKVTASAVKLSGDITATTGNIGGWSISSARINKLSGSSSDVNAGIILDSTNNRIIVSGSGEDTEDNSVKLLGNSGVIEVSQSGAGVFDTGRTIRPVTAQNFIVKSLPVASTTVGSAVPAARVTHLSASAEVGTKRIVVSDLFRMKNFAANLSAKTPFYVSVFDPLSQTKAVGSNATPIFFEVSRSYDTMNPAHEIGQSAVFSTVLNSGDDGGRFVGSSNTTGSAIYHFQTILTEASANHFDDAKLANIRSDVDVHDLAAAQQKQFVHFDARTSSGSKHNQRVFQVQYDGDVVSAGNITAFGASSNFLNVSDKRLKKNIHTISESLDRILELRPTEFVWKENDKRDIGFIAQEVEEIIPEIVETSEGFLDTHTDDESQDDVKTVSYSKLTPYLVDTIQELTKRIEELEKKVK